MTDAPRSGARLMPHGAAEPMECPDHPDVPHEIGFGLAGGGYGPYAYCPVCSRIVVKWQEIDEMEARTQGYGTIGWAVSHMLHGHRVRRASWRDAAIWVAYVPEGSVQVPHKFADGARVRALLVMRNADGTVGPYSAGQADLLAGDWELVDAVLPGTYRAGTTVPSPA